MENRGEELLNQLGNEYENTQKDTLTLEEYINLAYENPDNPRNGTPWEYVHQSLEQHGYRTVIEAGEELERPVAFDDPYHEGENAVLGNTALMNNFLSFLKKQSINPKAKIPFIMGPTATGKSELLENIERAIKDYSESEEGQLYTLAVERPDEMLFSNDQTHKAFDGGPTTYTDNDIDAEKLEESPININPLSIFSEYSEDQAEAIENELNQLRAEESQKMRAHIPERLDPQTKYYLEQIQDHYGEDKGLQEIIQDHVRVTPVNVEKSNGIGQLDSETESRPGSFKNDIIGSYPFGAEHTPDNFQYVGAFTNGSPIMVRMDDSDQYGQYLSQMQEIVDKNASSLPSGEPLPLNTVPIGIANYDFAKRHGMLKNQSTEERKESSLAVLDDSVKRRMKMFEMGYLTNYATESELIRRVMDKEWQFLDMEDTDEMMENIARPMYLENDEGETIEFAPHTVEAGSMAEVITRLDQDKLPGKNEEYQGTFPKKETNGTAQEAITLGEKLELFAKGYIERENGDERVRLEKYDFNFPEGWTEKGLEGIPVTYTVEIFEDLLLEKPEREVENGIGKVRTGYDVIDKMIEGLEDNAGVSDTEVEEFEEKMKTIEEQITRKYEQDLLDSIFHGLLPNESEVTQYIQDLEKLTYEDDLERHETQEDLEFRLREQEIELFEFDENQYQGAQPVENEVYEFRQEMMNDFNRFSRQWGEEQNGDKKPLDYEQISFMEQIETVRDRVGQPSFEGISTVDNNRFEGFSINEWSNKKLETTEDDMIVELDEINEMNDDTRQVKNRAIKNMIENKNYTLPSAQLIAHEIINRRTE